MGKIVAATSAHHAVPHRGDRNLMFTGELVSLCKWHHDSIAQEIERRGYDTTIGIDGWPTCPQHPANR
jgi:5-methylcytosine-specific restriction enzyme A